MKFTLSLILLISLLKVSFCQDIRDSTEVIKLNKNGYANRLIDPNQTIRFAEKALLLAKKINYLDGIAEAYRIMGIGKNYKNLNEDAIKDYHSSLTYFKRAKNIVGEAKVYNNIGILYREIDFDKALNYYNRALKIAKALNSEELIASLYGNIATIYQRKKNFTSALENYNKSMLLFKKLKKPIGVLLGNQNIGVLYFYMGDIDKSEAYLLEALKDAKDNNLNSTISSINLTLASIYIEKEKFKEAERCILEGNNYATIVGDSKLKFDYLYTNYQLENKRGNYQEALGYLEKVYKSDSTNYINDNSTKIKLIQEQFKFLERQKENELTIAKQRYNKVLFIGSTVAILLALLVIVLLIYNVKRQKKNNTKLTSLNQEVFKQKEDLDRINQNLEQLIDKRTRDLQIKNMKLSEYSSHLSHHIRGPIATMKGLLILEKDDLIEDEELIREIAKCVTEIDNRIININENLNNPDINTLTS